MGRKERRQAARKEKDPLQACMDTLRNFVPDLFEWFSLTKDPRNQSYTTYSNTAMLSQLFFKGIAGIVTMRGMGEAFNDERVSANIYSQIGERALEFLPHPVTANEYLERLAPEELEGILHRIAVGLIRRKTFNDARFLRMWTVIIDATQGYSGERKINDLCLERRHNKGTDKESRNYHSDVLEAKLYLGENMVVSLGSEFIENTPEYAAGDKAGAEKAKQDCETKAFKRLAEKLKKKYPRMPMLLQMDSLYASEPVIEICEGNHWDYLIRFKDGSIPSVAEEWEAIPERETAGHASFVNGIDYNGHLINFLHFYEDKVSHGETVRTEFQWITSLGVMKKNAGKMAARGRLRWKIENEGFNRQKNWVGNITHACSFNANALKNHYLMQQVSDVVLQLYERFFLLKNGIEKTYKKISSDLLHSLTKQNSGLEDTFQTAGAVTASG